MTQKMPQSVSVLVNGERHTVELLELNQSRTLFSLSGRTYEVAFEQSVPQSGNAAAPKNSTTEMKSPPKTKSAGSIPSGTGAQILKAPIPGLVLKILTTEGAAVKKGDILLRLEAMKMENNILCHMDGIVKKIFVSVGEEVSDSQPLIEIGRKG